MFETRSCARSTGLQHQGTSEVGLRLTSYAPEPGTEKIAVLRANLLGDLIVSLPALDALRAVYPRAEIVLIAREWHRLLLLNRPSPVDRVIALPELPGLREDPRPASPEPEIEAFFDTMRGERFDLALQLHGGGKYSNPIVRRFGARFTAGLRTPDAEPLDRWLHYDRNQVEVLRYLETVSLVGARVTTLEPRLAVVEEDVAEAQCLVPDNGQPLVALHPGARHSERRWPPERFAAVGNTLVTAGARVVVTGQAGEAAIVRRVLDAMTQPAENLCGRLSLRGLAGLYSRCSVVVSNDTGPLHLAGAVGAATVGIHWAYNFVGYGPLLRARHRAVVSWREDRPRCQPDCTDPFCEQCEPIVADIEAPEVAEHALTLLSGSGTGQTKSSERPAPVPLTR